MGATFKVGGVPLTRHANIQNASIVGSFSDFWEVISDTPLDAIYVKKLANWLYVEFLNLYKNILSLFFLNAPCESIRGSQYKTGA